MKTIEVDGKVYVEKPAEDFFVDGGRSTCLSCQLWKLPTSVGCSKGYPYCENASIVWVEKK